MLLQLCNKIIEYSFYALFFFLPLVFSSDTSELFEFNKMWFTYSITIVIAAAWSIKIIATKTLRIQKTPLDIPIVLFLTSQIIATLFSLDMHVSLWGYYSRFNGGLYSLASYIFLYYAFVSNVIPEHQEQTPEKKTFNVWLFLTGIAIFWLGFYISTLYDHSDSTVSGLSTATIIAGSLTSFIFFLWAIKNTVLNKLFFISIISGLLVALWGLPSHFGYDPTCLLFRGTFDVACWTESFQPKLRIFATLGQPNWIAAYLAILLPITTGLFLKGVANKKITDKLQQHIFLRFTFSKKNVLFASSILFTILLFYIDSLYANSRSGFFGLLAGAIVFTTLFLWQIPTVSLKQKSMTAITGMLLFLFWMLGELQPTPFLRIATDVLGILYVGQLLYFPFKEWQQSKDKQYIFFSGLTICFLALSLFQGTPSTLPLSHMFPVASTMPSAPSTESSAAKPTTTQAETPTIPVLENGGTDSGKIRKIVWSGALDAWRQNPIFGTGVETFAFAYYQHKPVAHNLTSEWDYLYNKAHNEYLNYLTTTGLFGLATYLSIIFLFLIIIGRKILITTHFLTSNTLPLPQKAYLLISGLLAAYASILISNFFGFSVVILNLYLFMIPAFVFMLGNMLNPEKTFLFPKKVSSSTYQVSWVQWLMVSVLLLTTLYVLLTLYRFWLADKAYGLGANLNRAGHYEQAYAQLKDALGKRGDEPVFQDEFAISSGVLAVAYAQQKQPEVAQQLAEQAVIISNKVTTEHPNNVVFLKSRTRLFYILSQLGQENLIPARDAMIKAHALAPTDAKIAYTLGVLYGQTGDIQKGIELLKKTIVLKPNYQEGYYTLGLFYHEAAMDKNGKIVNPEVYQQAVTTMRSIITNFPNNNKNAQDALKTWGEPL